MQSLSPAMTFATLSTLFTLAERRTRCGDRPVGNGYQQRSHHRLFGVIVLFVFVLCGMCLVGKKKKRRLCRRRFYLLPAVRETIRIGCVSGRVCYRHCNYDHIFTVTATSHCRVDCNRALDDIAAFHTAVTSYPFRTNQLKSLNEWG